MQVELWVWITTIAVLVAILLADFIFQLKKPHEPSFKESGIQVSIYITLALLFTFLVGGVWGPQYAAEYIAGWVTEYSLSVEAASLSGAADRNRNCAGPEIRLHCPRCGLH
jgi:tellurite resistance protein TerC